MNTFSQIRLPAVAGMFYPADPGELRRTVERFLAGDPRLCNPAAKAYVLPHAGYVYSGPVAGIGYRELQAQAAQVRRIVLLGPAHRVGFQGVAYTQHDAFATPLGPVPVDREAINAIRDLPFVVEMERAHQLEHSLEVHLPFLQIALDDFKIVPLVVGDAREDEVAEVLERLWGGSETRIVISSDLSHFHDYQTASALDQSTARSIERLESVVPEQACGAVPLDGLLCSARARCMSAMTLDLRNSGDTAGPRDRVVGYGAFSLSESV